MASPATETTATSTSLFQPSPNPRLSALEVVAFVLSMVLVFGGFYLFAAAFGHEWALELFAAGLIAETIGFWIAFGWLTGRK